MYSSSTTVQYQHCLFHLFVYCLLDYFGYVWVYYVISRWYWVNGCKSIHKLLISVVLVCVSNWQFLNQIVCDCVEFFLFFWLDRKPNMSQKSNIQCSRRCISVEFLSVLNLFFRNRFDCVAVTMRTKKKITMQKWSNEMTVAKYEHKSSTEICVIAIESCSLSKAKFCIWFWAQWKIHSNVIYRKILNHDDKTQIHYNWYFFLRFFSP